MPSVFGWFKLILILLAYFDTGKGIFRQTRIEQYGKPFSKYKLRTLHAFTFAISKIGTLFRKFKIDELPQLLNVIKGEMSVVSPRPDVPGYYDKLQGEERKILELKPGLTSLATLMDISDQIVPVISVY